MRAPGNRSQHCNCKVAHSVPCGAPTLSYGPAQAGDRPSATGATRRFAAHSYHGVVMDFPLYTATRVMSQKACDCGAGAGRYLSVACLTLTLMLSLTVDDGMVGSAAFSALNSAGVALGAPDNTS